MKYSYDYSEILNEIIEDLNYQALDLNSEIWIVRKDTPIFEDYYPIVDWYYKDDLKAFATIEDRIIATKVIVKDVLKEMEELNNLF